MTLQITFHKIKYFVRALNSNPFMLLWTKIFHIVRGDFSDCLMQSLYREEETQCAQQHWDAAGT